MTNPKYVSPNSDEARRRLSELLNRRPELRGIGAALIAALKENA